MKEEEKNSKARPDFVNPIDVDKIAENPHLLPYAHTVGGAVIKPIDKGRTKGLAVEAMRQQTQRQLDQLRRQMEVLAQEARALQIRVEVSELIYQADLNFKPIINHVYHLYRRDDETPVLSLIGPDEWGRRGCPYRFLATAKLLADHTWEILAEAEDQA